jgi:phage terminase small subunit
MALNYKQQRFVNEYCVDENGTQAAIRASYSEKTAGQIAHELLKKPEIKKAVEARMRQLAVAASVTPEWVVEQWARIAGADPNDLVRIRRQCCRHCHGHGHAYQWTEAEFTAALDMALNAGQEAPDGMGGFGFDPNKAPHEGCQECGGQGTTDVQIADTLKAKSPLYAGAERTRNGIKITMRDQDKAVENLARYMGMMVDRKEISGPGGGPVPVAGLTADDFSDEQLASMLAGRAK